MNAVSSEAEPPETGSTSPARRAAVVALVLVLAVAFGSWLRIDSAFSTAAFRDTDPFGLLRSDPGFLYYVTESIAEADGLVPDDFRADVHVEYPGTSDLPAMFSVGQEFFVAWTWKAFGGDLPLHRFAVIVMGLFASLSVIGVFGLARELTGKLSWAAAATALFLVLPGNYRTIGFVLIREDFALPFLALHLWLLARAWRVRTPASMALAGGAFVAAAATWHAMGFFLTIEAGVVFAWFLRSGRNPMAARGAGAFLLTVAIGALLVPVLFSKGFLLSIPVLAACSLWLTARCSVRLAGAAWKPRAFALGALAVLVVGGALLGPLVFPGAGDYAHVFALLSAKLANGGQLPADPGELSFDVRLLWQGPFATPHWRDLWGALGVGLFIAAAALAVGLFDWRRAPGDPRPALLFAMTLGGLVACLLVQRTLVLPAMLAPVAAVALLARWSGPARWVALGGLLLFQSWSFQGWITHRPSPWYSDPGRPGYVEGMMNELGEAVRWIRDNVPVDEPISSDFVTGTAVLAHAGNPMLVQPKYETTESRRRIQEFTEAYLLGGVREYRQLLMANECRYILVNQGFWYSNLHLAGIQVTPQWRPDPRTPFARLSSLDPAVYRSLPGFELLYEKQNQFSPGFMRVFRLVEGR